MKHYTNINLSNFATLAIVMAGELMHEHINLIGPLTLSFDLKVKHGTSLCGDNHGAQYKNLSYGGALLRIARLLMNIEHPVNVIGFVGDDEFGAKIIKMVKEERINCQIQKLPAFPTMVTIRLKDKRDFSTYTTQVQKHTLNLWKARLKHMNPHGIIYIEPSVPSEIQVEIIKQYKHAQIIVRKPLDNKEDIFFCDKKLIILLNESDAFFIFTKLEKSFFDPFELFRNHIFTNHILLIEFDRTIATLDEDKQIVQINFDKANIGLSALNDYFIAGLIAGLTSKQTSLNAFKQGLYTAIQARRQEKDDEINSEPQSKELQWEEPYIAVKDETPRLPHEPITMTTPLIF